MIPDGLQRAMESGSVIPTDAGSGRASVRRLADLVLPSGQVVLGLPDSSPTDESSSARLEIAPGRYPVFVSLVDLPRGYKELAFVVVRFQDVTPLSWEEVGEFFTDSGTGCLMDERSVPLLIRQRDAHGDFWRDLYDLKSGVFSDGDCNLLLDELTGANAVVFATHDSRYPCFLGRDEDVQPVWLVVDCR